MESTTEYKPVDEVPQRGLYSIFSGLVCLGEARFAPFSAFPTHTAGPVTYRFKDAA